MRKSFFLVLSSIFFLSCSNLSGTYEMVDGHLKENANPMVGLLGFAFSDTTIITISKDSIYFEGKNIGYHDGKRNMYFYEEKGLETLSAKFQLKKDTLLVEDEDLCFLFVKQKN